jgi:hypothetical protein
VLWPEGANWREAPCSRLHFCFDLVDLDLGFDLIVSGFEVAKIDIILGEAAGAADEADQLPEKKGIGTRGSCARQ